MSDRADVPPPGYREENREVFYRDESIVIAGPTDIAYLKLRAKANRRLRSRLCTHPDPSTGVHEMLIVHHRDVIVSPHKHLGKAESFYLMEGAATVLFFEEDGAVRDAVRVGQPGSGLPFYYRIPPDVIHSFIIESEWLVFHEVAQGPFDRANMISPPWAPRDDDPDAWQSFLRSHRAAIESSLASSR